MPFRKIIVLLILSGSFVPVKAQLTTPFEKSGGKSTATLQECLAFYELLHKKYPKFTNIEIPRLPEDQLKYHDAGKMRLVKLFNPDSRQPKVKIFINNGIHPGEPDGIDGSMMLCRDILEKPELTKLLDDVEIYVIPVYNTGGTERRGCCSRANQDGPLEYGFRGTDLNLDLNRDFMKSDAIETMVLEKWFHEMKPEFFIDTHVSDGADYQYTMTLISSQPDKYQDAGMNSYQRNMLLPLLYERMQITGGMMSPYVEFEKEIPDSGLIAFFDTPRFSSGYASLFSCFSFMSETHMLKPFDKRVKATYSLLLEMIKLAAMKKAEILEITGNAVKAARDKEYFNLRWRMDTTSAEQVTFYGYTAYFDTSRVTGTRQLRYDRNKPYAKHIAYYNTYYPVDSIKAPAKYLMPYEWYSRLHLERYDLNISVIHDTTVEVQYYMIKSYDTGKKAYEGHYTHSNTITETVHSPKILPGSWVVIDLKENARYRRMLVELLEPRSPDGFFTWGLMDAILQQKEGYSDYVWDARAYELLQHDAKLKKIFEERKEKDEKFAHDPDAQLEFIYQNSAYFENTYMRYPVYRVE
jgi:hypothetical protein